MTRYNANSFSMTRIVTVKITLNDWQCCTFFTQEICLNGNGWCSIKGLNEHCKLLNFNAEGQHSNTEGYCITNYHAEASSAMIKTNLKSFCLFLSNSHRLETKKKIKSQYSLNNSYHYLWVLQFDLEFQFPYESLSWTKIWSVLQAET